MSKEPISELTPEQIIRDFLFFLKKRRIFSGYYGFRGRLIELKSLEMEGHIRDFIGGGKKNVKRKKKR